MLYFRCNIFASLQGISGDTFRLLTISQSSSRYTHVFDCPYCVMSSLSAVNLAFDRLCQHLTIDIACLDAEGNAYLASHVASASSPLLRKVSANATAGGTLPLSSVTMRIPLSLSAQNNELTDVKSRGLVMLSADVSLDDRRAISPQSVNISIEVSSAHRCL